MSKLVGLYSEPRMLIEHPGYFDALIDAVGLTHVLMAGYELSPETTAKNPLPPGEEQYVPSPGNGDHRGFCQAMDIAHGKGLQVWARAWGWHGNGGRFPELCMQDMHHRRLSEVPELPYALEQQGIAFCPNYEPLNDYLMAVYAEIAANYDAEGVNLSHCRYTAPSFFHNLFGCACKRCEVKAQEQGYDFDRMRRSVLAFWDRLHHLDARTVQEAGRRDFGTLELVQWLGIDEGLIDWFVFRSSVITHHLQRFKTSTEEAAGRDIVFGFDSFPPSLSILVGHAYPHFLDWADYISPLISHVEIFILSAFASYADLLCTWNDGLDETDALRFVYRLSGYDQIAMPQSLDALGVKTPNCEVNCQALPDIVELELRRARTYNPGKVPSYPVIKGGTWSPDIVQRLVQTAEHMGHDGIIFQGTEALLDYPGID